MESTQGRAAIGDVDAAVDFFIEHGFVIAKLSDIAKRARVVEGTIYRYLEKKEDLSRTAARHMISANLDGLEEVEIELEGSLKN